MLLASGPARLSAGLGTCIEMKFNFLLSEVLSLALFGKGGAVLVSVLL